MATTDELLFEMQRRVILFNSGTTMPDNINVLGYEGNPNYASTATSGQTLLYNSPRGTHYIELVNGNLWYKQQIPNTWINLTSGTQSGIGSFTTGDQTITGIKNFATGIFAPNLVYNTGDQTIAGIKNFYSRPTVNGTGVLLIGETASVDLPNTLVYNTGNQIIGGTKTFASNLEVQGTGIFNSLDLNNIDTLNLSGVDLNITNGNIALTNRPTVNGTPVLISGEANTTISGVLYSAQINIKNDNGSTIYKGQPVYVSSAAGTNILVKLASNSGEQTSSKTLGLLYQTSLAQNAQGTIVTEGLLQGFNTNAGEEGDPIWLGPTGSLIFGLANKPYAPNHLVYLGVLTRKHANQGEVFVKIQNGFELEELHNLNINHKNTLADKNIIKYDSASGIWFNDTINSVLPNTIVYNTGDQTISGIKTFANNLEVQGTGIFNALDLSNISEFNFSGTNINLISGNVNISGQIYISGNPVSTGIDLSSYATTANLATTGTTLQTNINNLSGYINSSASNIIFTTGNQIISGLKTFNTGLSTRYISGVSGSSLDIIGFSGEVVSAANRTINIQAGHGPSGIPVGGGSININAGNALNTSASPGGITLRAGNSPSPFTTAGSINLIAGTGGAGFGTPVGINLYGGQSPNYDGYNNIFGNVNVNYNGTSFSTITPKTISIYRSGNAPFGPGLLPFQQLGVLIDNNKVDVNNGMVLQVSGVNVTPSLYIDNLNNQNISGTKTFAVAPILSGNPLITGVDLSSYLTSSTASSTYATIINLASTGSTLSTNLNTKINNLSGYINSTSSNIIFITGNQNIGGNKTFTGVTTFSGQQINLIDTALNLSGIGDMTFDGTNINFINSPVFISGTNLRVSGNVIANNLIYKTENQTISGIKTFASRPTVNGTGVLLIGEASNVTLPNTIVYTTGNQIISGVKTFAQDTTFGNASEDNFLVISGNNFTVYGSGNFTSGLFVNGNAVLTGVNLSSYATVANLVSTGSTLDTKINNLSGYINSPRSNIIFTTGNQIISGNKTFKNNIVIENTGFFNALDLSDTDNILLSGIDIQIVSGGITLTNMPIISGNPLITGNLSLYARTDGNIVFTTGSQSIDGIKTFQSNTFFTKDVNVTQNLRVSGNSFFTGNLSVTGNLNVNGSINNPNLVLTSTNQTIDGTKTFNVAPIFNGNPLITAANLSSYAPSSEVVYTTGVQSIAGLKTFSSNALFTNDVNVNQNIRATGSVYFNDNLYVTNNLTVGGNINNPNLVLTKSKQTISGVKTFADKISINAYTDELYDVTNLDYRLNIGGSTDENIGIQIDAYGINPPQLLMRRARGTPTNLSGVLKDDVLFNLQARGYVSGLNNYSTNSRAAIRLIAAEDWVGIPNYTGQGTNILFRTTNIGSGLATDKVIIGTSGLNVLDGNIYISGNPVLTGVLPTTQNISNIVYATGNQIVSGTKDFQSAPLVSGKEVYYQRNVVYFTGNTFTPDYALGRNFVYQLTGFATVYNNLNNPINVPEGDSILVKVVQSNFGNNYMIFGSNYRFPASASPTLSQPSGRVDIFNILKLDNKFYTTYVKDFAN